MPEQNASQEILDAAERVFALCGFEGASMRQIATEAGVAQALLHYHFGTKEKLFHAMFARRSEAIQFRAGGTPREPLRVRRPRPSFPRGSD
jgi:AcrR family transcriptional regulator